MIKYNVTGNDKGDTIIFINGAGVGAWMWDNQVEYFANYKCITFDLPGHGMNNEIDFTTIEACSMELKGIIQKESISPKAILIGHSIGAQIVMSMLEHHNEYIDRAIIISGLNKSMPFVNAIIRPMIACTMLLSKWKSFSKLQSKQLAIPDSMFDNYYKDSINISKATLSNVLYENSNYNFLNDKKVKIKTLILVGKNEKNIMKESSKKINALLDNSIGYIVKNASHGIPYEQSELLNHTIENFIHDREIVEDNLINMQ